MGIKVNITQVNKEANFISFNQNGESKVADIVVPAKITYARTGEAEIGFNQDGKVNYVKMTKTEGTNTPKVRTHNAYNEVKIVQKINLIEFERIYNEMSQMPNIKINATNILNERVVDGVLLIDVIFFRTRFEKIQPDMYGTDDTI